MIQTVNEMELLEENQDDKAVRERYQEDRSVQKDLWKNEKPVYHLPLAHSALDIMC